MTSDRNSPSPERPRVLYFINTYDNGGAEIALVKLISGQLFEGVDLQVVALIKGTGAVRPQLEALGVEAHYLIDREKMRLSDLAVAYWKLGDRIREFRPDFLIGSLPQANIVGRFAAMRQRNITFISFEHNTHLAKPIYEKLFRLTSSRVDWVFADAAKTLEVALERLYRSHPASGQQYVIPMVSFDPKDSHPYAHWRKDRPFQIINAARLTETKNQGQIIRALKHLLDADYDVHLTLYGEGGKRAEYEALARELGVENNLSMPGFIPDWPKHEANAFVLASHHEGLCIVVLEAMHAGIPVIGPLVGGIQDYGSTRTMEVVAEVTPEALADAIIKTIENPAEAKARTQRAAAVMATHYSTESSRAAFRRLNTCFFGPNRKIESHAPVSAE